MRLPNEAQREHPWRVHGHTRDYELLDVWEVPVEGDAVDLESPPFARYAEVFADMEGLIADLPWPARALFAVRDWLGRAMDLDDPEEGFEPVYTERDEQLLELSNKTVDALLHLGWAAGRRPTFAVYVVPRGWFGRAYMAAISPFRHLIVYPALVRSLARRL